jgi:ATP-dependent DNA ligase
MLASPGRVTGLPRGWAAEVKWDGWRAVVSVDGTVKVRTRRGRHVIASLPEPAPLAETLAGRSVILDGEFVTCVAGAVDFYRLAGRMAASRRTGGEPAFRAAAASPVTLVIFDCSPRCVDLTGQPLLNRIAGPRRAGPGRPGVGREPLVSGGERGSIRRMH